jgi:hypothetical protein
MADDQQFDETCYMCSAPAVSREHVPPKCLFPEAKDIGGLNLRNELITVPSCAAHNSGKSCDDEFLMMSLAGIVGNNSIGYRHWTGKVDRALRRSSYRVLNSSILKPQRMERLVVRENHFIDVIWGTPDLPRLLRCFDQVLRGLYFHDFGQRFDGKVQLIPAFIKHEPGQAHTWQKFIEARCLYEADSMPRIGGNPEVFYYQRFPTDEFGLIAYRLCLYGGVDVYACLIPVTARMPGNLVTEMISGGMKTVITVGEKAFTFN